MELINLLQITIAQNEGMDIFKWIISGFMTLFTALIVHFGNEASKIKKIQSKDSERIGKVEVMVDHLHETAHRMEDNQHRLEDKIDKLIERK